MQRREKAIILGGGISGKLTARVLSNFYKEVIIIERDQEPTGPFPRKGAPQGNHIHALLHAGEYGLEKLFPGITENFYSTGAVKINSTQDLAWFHHGVWKLRYDGGYTTTLQTRPHLEWHVEQYLRTIPNITILYNNTFRDYEYDETENRIIGIKINDGSSVKTIYGDLIVDASGASSMTTGWLKNRGIQIPEEKVKIGLIYISKVFQLPADLNRDWTIKLVYPNPPQEKIGGTISKIEGNRYIVTFIGYHDEIDEKQVLKNDSSFLELAKKLPKDDIYQALKEAVPVSNTSVFRVPQIIWRKYEKIKQLPNGLLLIGDTICRIDPVFGQGMSIAVLETLALQNLLQNEHQSQQQLIRAFQQRAAKIIAPIWSMVLTEDFRYPATIGKKPFILPFMQWYSKNIFLLSAQNQETYHTFIKVMNLVRPITILMNPKILYRVLKRTLLNHSIK
ncbi:FAD-dependent oxidoreductase [Neobacillus dielmonensis]|uniref:FAD-dependent oxidoreductase n=1 Tax=Neobacillus dielmonensis TaxID=1347369 RepID=UPI0005A9F416|nr:FAD-dependent monooxygenase [Neobacillus dielmonensis]